MNPNPPPIIVQLTLTIFRENTLVTITVRSTHKINAMKHYIAF